MKFLILIRMDVPRHHLERNWNCMLDRRISEVYCSVPCSQTKLFSTLFVGNGVRDDGPSEQGFREQLDMGHVHKDRYRPEAVLSTR